MQSLYFHAGLFALMNQCPSGSSNGLVLGGCFALESTTHLKMNTTQHVVACQES